MQYVQGYPGSHWTPPTGNYLLRFAPVAARATEQTNNNKKNGATLLAILMAMVVRWYDTVGIAG
jgi:hypothetical protein